ncbi:MAG TPA: hypothetical protein VHB97_08855, partial [Polyangia bacterium]|nr:hypothetical protein [Polyangia bacterium]
MKPHSSTSASEPRPLRRFIRLSLAVCALFCVAIELSAIGFVRFFSLTDKRVHQEHAAAMALRPGTRPRSLLILGNSLVELGVDLPRLKQLVGDVWAPQRYMMEATGFLDWYYGLQRLFREGSRPDEVLLVLSGRQLIARGVAGADFSHYLMDRHDLVAVAKEIGASRTATTNMLFENLSVFYGTRAHIRNRLLQVVLPDFDQLTGGLAPPRTGVPQDEATAALVVERVARMARLCREHGARLVVLIPPTNAPDDDGAQHLARAGRLTGV